MGACYSKKASGGNRQYTTVPMASTKLDEASRLARATPYARAPNANVDYGTKKSIPMSTKYNSCNTVDPGNLRNNPQSNIPRFSSSLPVTSPSEQKAVIPSCNDNESLHIMNNNCVVTSRSSSNIPNTYGTPMNRFNKTESLGKPKNLGSKSCPEKIVTPTEDKSFRTPCKATSLPRQAFARSPNFVSHMNPESPYSRSNQSKNIRDSPNSVSNLGKSPSQKGYESRDSLSDFDSGLGGSINTDKQKPEDSDTIKDLEGVELSVDSSPSPVRDSSSVNSANTHRGQFPKSNVKAPTYKREPNGKWSFSPESEQPLNGRNRSGNSSPREKNSFKMNASENIFSTYASYKGLLSYQKKSFKPLEPSGPSREKSSTPDRSKESPASTPNASCIPKIRKQPALPLTNRSSLFYVQAENDKPQTLNVAGKSSRASNLNEKEPKQSQSVKQASVDSDEKSDSTTENGVSSPPSDVGDRDFLIDDEIADQPDLTLCCDPLSEDSDLQSLQMAVSELHALQLTSSLKKRTDSVSSYSSKKSRAADHRDSLILGSDLGSSCSSIASDDLMLDYEKSLDGFPEGTVNEGLASPMKKIEVEDDQVTPLRAEKLELDEKTRKRIYRRSSGPFASASEKLEWRQRTVSLPLRPPRPMSFSEADDGGLKLDSSSYRLLCQDLNGVKTLLLRLKTVIQEAETINPFDQGNPKNIFYQSLVHNDFPADMLKDGEDPKSDAESIVQENADLKRQIVLLQQQLEDKDHTIHLLQQQMTKYGNFHGGVMQNPNGVNAATQTEKRRSLTSSVSNSSISADDSTETVISAQEDFEKTFRRKSAVKDHLTEHLKEVTRILESNSSAFYVSDSEC